MQATRNEETWSAAEDDDVDDDYKMLNMGKNYLPPDVSKCPQ